MPAAAVLQKCFFLFHVLLLFCTSRCLEFQTGNSIQDVKVGQICRNQIYSETGTVGPPTYPQCPWEGSGGAFVCVWVLPPMLPVFRCKAYVHLELGVKQVAILVYAGGCRKLNHLSCSLHNRDHLR